MILIMAIALLMSIVLLINSIFHLFEKPVNFNTAEVTEEYTEFTGTMRNIRRTIRFDGERGGNYISYNGKYLP